MFSALSTGTRIAQRSRTLFARTCAHQAPRGMGKKKGPSEEALSLPPHPSGTETPIIDTHTHLISTFGAYRQKYKDGQHETVFDFVKNMYAGRRVEAIVDVWCEAPVQRVWREIADSAVEAEDRERNWGGIEYWFVMGVHPHEAKLYNDDVERDILEAMAHPRCVGWGEIGLDYHYDNSPRDTQREVFARQLRQAVRLGKPLTIHTREADDDTERILKAEVPQDHRIHIHCFTDSPKFAQRLLAHFPDLYIGITGVVTYATNENTANLLRALAAQSDSPRFILETDAPFMIPANIYTALPSMKGRLPLCHTAMIPWTAEFVADVVGEGWSTDRVMALGRENGRKMYGL
ncbi:Metallo-dependent hydrolase [Auriscalpium vulgare]|uniref:Metallo-dependent hydrolase n=1 Tax=Auriscalpium vulgare TaxID=40419 RepID=A0ACB8RSV1_9AGAM|nr:Metallo-dependent hydrolase [Auriscalpium vulgare]